MREAEFLNVDPATLRLPPSRESGADPVKLHRQLARFVVSIAGKPPLIVYRCSDGELVIYDGATRATCVAKFLPKNTVTVEVAGKLSIPGANRPTIKERLP
jgi:hypothetical protein